MKFPTMMQRSSLILFTFTRRINTLTCVNVQAGLIGQATFYRDAIDAIDTSTRPLFLSLSLSRMKN